MMEADSQMAASEPASSVAEVTCESECVKNQLLSSMEQGLRQFGGPSQFLTKMLETEQSYKDFMTWLWDEFPETEDEVFSYQAALPTVTEVEVSHSLPLIVHVSALGFTVDCTIKPPCGSELALRMAELYLVEGFVTGDQPLYTLQHQCDVCLFGDVTPPWCNGHADRVLKAFNLSYLKGFGRSTTLLMVLYCARSAGVNLAEQLPHFHASVRKIYVHCIRPTSRVEEALTNMKISARHSLRTAHNTVQSVFVIRKLMLVGGLQDSTQFVKKWNSMSAKAFQITGRRQTALKLLFEVAPQDCASQHGGT